MFERRTVRGTFEDVLEAFKTLRNILSDDERWKSSQADELWNEIEDLLDRAFLGFMPPQLERFLALVRKYRLYRRRYYRQVLKRAIMNHRNIALREAFRHSWEREISKTIEKMKID